ARTETEELDDLVRQLLLAFDREVALEERVVHLDVAQLCDEGDEPGLHLSEDLSYLGSGGVRLEVVEQDVVRLLHLLETCDAASPDGLRDGRIPPAASSSVGPRTATG